MNYSKESSNLFRGIEFVVLDDLPSEQRDSLVKWLSPDDLIKISTGKTLYENCVQFSIYSNWFDNVFLLELERKGKETVTEKAIPIQLRPAF